MITTEIRAAALRLHDRGEVWAGDRRLTTVLYQLRVLREPAGDVPPASSARTTPPVEVGGTLLAYGNGWTFLQEQRDQDLWLRLEDGRRLRFRVTAGAGSVVHIEALHDTVPGTPRVGVREIDVEHEELVAMLNELASTPRRWLLRRPSQGVEDPALLAWIDAMQAWAESHFATEERLMQAFSYPDYERHQGAHRTLVDEIRDIRAALESREIAVDSWLVQRLRDWWQRHTERADAPLGQFIAEQGPADTDLNRG